MRSITSPIEISLIVAFADNRVIGINNSLPWHLSADLKRFRRLTMGKPILMGRKTFESIGRPLPGRINVIVTRNKNYQPEGCIVCHSLEVVLEKFKDHPALMIIGGESLYEIGFPIAHRLYLTRIHHHFEGDRFFPEFNLDQWKVESRQDYLVGADNPYNFSFIVYIRK